VFHLADFGDSPRAFVRSLLDFFRGPFNALKPSLSTQPRVIVRCETSTEVNDVASLLRAAGESVLAIHETFTDRGDDFRRRTVPPPQKRKETFWVHQYKLIEGLDDPSFCLLAIFRPFGNGRSLVQQIGRIVRNPGRSSRQTAHVFAGVGQRQDAYWANYRKYESVYESNPERFDLLGLFDNFVSIQPEFLYFDGNYRARFSIDDHAVHTHFQYPLSTRVYSLRETLSMQQLTEAVQEEWLNSDLLVRNIQKPDSNTRVIAYATLGNSPTLLDHALVQFELGFTVFRRKAKYLFFYDTEGKVPEYLRNRVEPVDPNRLQRLLIGQEARVSQLSLLNTDLGRHSVRRRVIHARSLAETSPNLVDHAHVCSTATGYSNPAPGKLSRR